MIREAKVARGNKTSTTYLSRRSVIQCGVYIGKVAFGFENLGLGPLFLSRFCGYGIKLCQLFMYFGRPNPTFANIYVALFYYPLF